MDSEDTPIYIQPLAQVDYHSRDMAMDAIEDHPYSSRLNDLHMGNVAIYRGKAVTIDW